MKNKKLAQVFKNAIPYLSLSDNEEITGACHSICYAIAAGNEPSPSTKLARQIIHKRLGVHILLESWLRDRIGNEAVNRDYATGSKKLQATRLAWLNSLVEEFS